MDIPQALSFDDVLIVPARSEIRSRKDVVLTTQLTKNIEIGIPLISANMDSVTESKMAIAIARLGGIGIIHRFLTIDEEVDEVRKVKRAENVVIEDPYIIGPDATVADARSLFEKKNITGLPVVDENRRLVGMVTKRDLLFEDNGARPLREIMTPGEKLIVAPRNTTHEEAKKILHAHRIEKLPLVDGAGILQGLITLRDLLQRERFPIACKDSKGRLRVGAAVGVKDDVMERTSALLKAGADVIVVDVAHGHAEHTIEVVKKLKATFDGIEIIAGNVATGQGAKDLIDAGADGIKVGVGPGGMCSTRIVAGAGVPQLSAILDCARVGREENIPIIADGGIKSSAHLAKALAAGASTAMIGTIFAGTTESPGLTIVKDGQKFKLSRGMASLTAAMGRAAHENKDPFDASFSEYVPEGVETLVPYRGELRETALEFLGGLRSGMSYVGARSIPEFWERAKFVQMTAAGMNESVPHGKR